MKHGVVTGAQPLSPAGRQAIKEIIHSYLGDLGEDQQVPPML